MKRITLCVALAALVATSGCEGCDAGPATKYCQQALDGIDASYGQLLDDCKTCCHQEVPYKGTLENGQCVCHRP